MQQHRTAVTGLAFVFLALMLAALAIRFWVGEKGYQFTGPTHIAAGEDRVYLHAAGDLYTLAGSGELLSVMQPELTGLRDIPIDLRVLPDGRLLLAEQDPASIRICQADPWQCRPLAPVAVSILKQQFKVIPGASDNEFFLTDARGDTLWRLIEGTEPQKLLPERTLAGPNDLAFDAAANLWVADTDHRRILELRPQDDGTFAPGREHSALNSFTVGKRYYPMMMARAADDRWWVIQATEFSEALADVAIYDPEKGAQAVIGLPQGAYPTDIAALGQDMLVTDLERFTVYRVDSRTLAVSAFGDEGFRKRLDQGRKSRTYYEYLGTGSLFAVVLFAALMLLAAIRATPREERWTEPPGSFDVENAAEQVPQTGGIHWLERDPRMDRRLKWFETLAFIPLVMWIVLGVVLYGWVTLQTGPDPAGESAAKLNELVVIFILGGLGAAFVIPIAYFQVQNMKQKLGTDGKSLYIRLADGRELRVDPSRLFYTRQAVHYRQYTFPLQGAQRKSIYLDGEVDTWLAPLLRQAGKLTAVEALRYRWKNPDSLFLWSVSAGVAMVLVVIVLQLLQLK